MCWRSAAQLQISYRARVYVFCSLSNPDRRAMSHKYATAKLERGKFQQTFSGWRERLLQRVLLEGAAPGECRPGA